MKNEHGQVVIGFDLIDDEKFKIDYNSPLLQNQILDYLNVPEEQRPGQMRRLLCAAAVGCFAGSAYDALKTRGASVKSLNGTGTAITGKKNGSHKRVQEIDIIVEVEIEDKNIQVLERVKKVLEKGCLVTRSLEPSITVSRTIIRKGY